MILKKFDEQSTGGEVRAGFRFDLTDIIDEMSESDEALSIGGDSDKDTSSVSVSKSKTEKSVAAAPPPPVVSAMDPKFFTVPEDKILKDYDEVADWNAVLSQLDSRRKTLIEKSRAKVAQLKELSKSAKWNMLQDDVKESVKIYNQILESGNQAVMGNGDYNHKPEEIIPLISGCKS